MQEAGTNELGEVRQCPQLLHTPVCACVRLFKTAAPAALGSGQQHVRPSSNDNARFSMLPAGQLRRASQVSCAKL